jgi:hypothetical protein
MESLIYRSPHIFSLEAFSRKKLGSQCINPRVLVLSIQVATNLYFIVRSVATWELYYIHALIFKMQCILCAIFARNCIPLQEVKPRQYDENHVAWSCGSPFHIIIERRKHNVYTESNQQVIQNQQSWAAI